MATGTTYGTNYTIADTKNPTTFLDSAKWNGKLRALTETYTAAAQIDLGSHIYVGTLPVGAIPRFAIISTAAGATGEVTGTIGSATTAALFGTFTTIAAASTQFLVATAANTPLTAETAIRIVTAGGHIATSSIIDVQLFWSEHN